MTDVFTTTIAKPQKINYIRCFEFSLEPSKFEFQAWWASQPTELAIQKCLETADKRLEQVKIEHEANKNNIEHNKQQRIILQNLLSNIGLRTSWSIRKIVRNRPKFIKEFSTWQNDILETYPIDDGFEANIRYYEQTKKNCEEYKKKIEIKKQELVRKQEEEKEKRKQNRTLVKLQLKYCNENEDYDFDEILDIITSKDKYLRLAIAMYKTRCDFSDGCGRVAVELSNFDTENEQDQKIYECIGELCSEWQCDGRVFRDCEWNYDVLYSLVKNKELYDDAMLCLEMSDKYE